MRRGIVGKMVLRAAGALLACGLSAGTALATPTCTTTLDLGAAGSGVVAKSSFTSGFCVKANDKIYSNFNLTSLPATTVVSFNLNTFGGLAYYGIAFGSTYQSGHTYDWSYEVTVSASAPAGTAIVELDTDFTQTAGTSTLTQTTNPAGIGSINEVKNGAIVQPGSVTQSIFAPGVTDLQVSLHLVDNGTISSVTNTIIQQLPGQNIPEPLSLSLFGAGLAGLGIHSRAAVALAVRRRSCRSRHGPP
jgi:hypothetical protein